ncbi:MAG: hypothetical protein IPM59_03325 [Chloracidobacterium sp.]|nr:hypothetical protein [Chloracidobacterium sp.]
MSRSKRPDSRPDEPTSGTEKAYRERDRRLGLFIVEVARATHEGRLPVNQTDIRRSLKKNFRLDLPPATSTSLTNILKHEYRNKIWLKVDGQKVTLFSEDETLVDSRAIRALYLAREELNDDGHIALTEWKELCASELNLSDETCEEFLNDFIKCRYIDGPDKRGFLKVDVRAIGEDEFYLAAAAKAGLKKSIARTKPARL